MQGERVSMREIKFRVWGKHSKEYLRDFRDNKDVFGFTIQELQNVEHLEDWELQQYTGLKDRHGVEIYEGDIVEVDGKYDNSKAVGIVAWYDSHTGFSIDFRNDGLLGALDQRLEVIGNIYENPELCTT